MTALLRRCSCGLLLALLVSACGAEDTSLDLSTAALAADGATLTGVTLTHYVLATEASTSGQNTGDASLVCDAMWLDGCYHEEFLCSGYGVAMQGTGLADDGNLVRYVSGGGGWQAGYQWLNDCGSAVFSYTDGVYGASGRQVVADWSVAVDPGLIPLGWYVWIESEGHWFRADDTGGAIVGKHLDLYMGVTGQTPSASSSKIYVTSDTHEKWDPSPFDAAAGPATSPKGLWPADWAKVGGSPVKLTWSAVSGATAYDVFVKVWHDGAWAHYYTLSVGAASTGVALAVPGATYAFAVRGRAGEVTGPLSGWATFVWQP